MADPNEGIPIFVDVGSQNQFPMQPGSFAVFSHSMSKQDDQIVKEENMEEVMHNAPNSPPKIISMDFDFPIAEKQEDTTEPMPVAESVKKTQEATKNIKCTEVLNGSPCPYKTDTDDRLLRHVRKVHRGENPFQCTMCDYSTYNKALFEEHVRIHQGIKPFKCSYCDYASVSKKNTKKHELRHRADNPLKCPQCDFFARHDRSLQVHMKTHNGGFLKCNVCGFKAETARSLENHKQRKHVQKEKLNIYGCDHCDAKFNEEKNVNAHMKKAKTCPECGVQLCSKIIYNTHMATVHQIEVDGDVIFKCALCEWTCSTSKSRILLHLIHHPGQHVDESMVDLSILKKYGIM